jgi:UDP-glucose 4-epimerase
VKYRGYLEETKNIMQKKKSVLITGIAGFIGQNLSRILLEKGWEIYGVDNLEIGCKEWLPKDIWFEQFDVCNDLQSMYGPFKDTKYDLIIHLASKKIPRYGGADKVLLENAGMTKSIISFATKTKTKLIYLSSSDVYGKQTGFKETSNFIIGNSDILRWSYAISKIWGEQLLYSTHSSLKGFDFNIIRLFGTYGPYHALSWTAGPQSVFISQALKKEPITLHGDGLQKRCFQYIDDAVDGILRVMESDYKREIFNIGNPDMKKFRSKIWAS